MCGNEISNTWSLVMYVIWHVVCGLARRAGLYHVNQYELLVANVEPLIILMQIYRIGVSDSPEKLHRDNCVGGARFPCAALSSYGNWQRALGSRDWPSRNMPETWEGRLTTNLIPFALVALTVTRALLSRDHVLSTDHVFAYLIPITLVQSPWLCNLHPRCPRGAGVTQIGAKFQNDFMLQLYFSAKCL